MEKSVEDIADKTWKKLWIDLTKNVEKQLKRKVQRGRGCFKMLGLLNRNKDTRSVH